MPPRSLNALDEQIAALKRKLREAAGASGDDDSGSGSDASSSSGSEDDSSGSELPPIAPLPPQALPEFYTKEAAKARGEPPAEPPPLRRPPKAPAADGEVKPRRKKRRAGEGVAAAAESEGAGGGEGASRPRCTVCSLLFTSDAQLAEHLQGKKHAQKERAQRLGPNAPPPAPSWRPNANPELQGPACALCRKQFTSAAQLEEHKLGKWHQMRLRGELQPAGGGRRA